MTSSISTHQRCLLPCHRMVCAQWFPKTFKSLCGIILPLKTSQKSRVRNIRITSMVLRPITTRFFSQTGVGRQGISHTLRGHYFFFLLCFYGDRPGLVCPTWRGALLLSSFRPVIRPPADDAGAFPLLTPRMSHSPLFGHQGAFLRLARRRGAIQA